MDDGNYGNSDGSRATDADAVVVGAGMTGLMVARVLSRHARHVVVLDHDDLPEGGDYRKGAAQMYHSHVLLDRGAELIDEMFPGLVRACSVPAAHPVDHGEHLAWQQYGRWKPRNPAGVCVWQFDRARVEGAMRERVRQLEEVELLSGRKVVDYCWSEDGERIRGVRARIGGGDREVWRTRLVVDAMGRGTRTPRLVEKRRGTEIPRQSYSPRITYTTCDLTWPDGLEWDWSGVVVMPESPRATRAGVAYPVDSERFRMTLAGWTGDRAPTDAEGFRDFARTLPTPLFDELLEHTERRTRGRRYRIQDAEFRRYDRWSDAPAGLIVVGDSLCGFNPIFGQGISIAARETRALDSLLEREAAGGDLLSPAGCAAYFDRAARIVRGPWLLTAAYDHQFPGVEGDRRLPELLSPVVQLIHRASGYDAGIYRDLLRVMHMQADAATVFRPSNLGSLTRMGVLRLFERFAA